MASRGDTEWETMLSIAKLQQQNWYEMLPEWTVYDESDFQYLKLKIAMAIFGLPEKDSGKVTPQTSTDDDLTQYFQYNPLQRETIDIVYNKILTHGTGYKGFRSICYSLLYTIYFRTKIESVPEQEIKKAKETKDQTQEHKPDDVKVHIAPLFKIQKQANTNSCPTEIWFIDIHGRVYKSWNSYKSDNTLPACTMVLPRDGLYQPDLDCLLTEDISTVSLEICCSPACDIATTLCNAADTGSTVASVVGMGIGVASMFTPVGPVVAGVGLTTSAASGLWTVGRSAHHLVDRSLHEESISITEPQALGSWIGIAASVFGVAASAGTSVLTQSARAGQNISKAARIASNTAIGGSLFFNGAGVMFQGFNIYTKYRDTDTIDPADVLFFTAHVFFFSSAVINVKFASNLIESTHGQVIEDFETNIRSKRMRKAFNRASNRAESTADVVRFVNAKKDILANMKPSANASTSTSENASTSMPRSVSVLKFVNGKIKIKNEYLLDPMQFVRNISIQNASYRASMERRTDACGNVVFISLKNHLQAYVESLCGSVKSVLALKIVEEATDVLMEMLHVRNPEDMLSLIVQVVVELLSSSATPERYFVAALQFVLSYVKAHLKRRITDAEGIDSTTMYKVLHTIVESMEMLMPVLKEAFKVYLGQTSQ